MRTIAALLFVPAIAFADEPQPDQVNVDVGASAGALITDYVMSDVGGDNDNYGSLSVFARGALPITSSIDVGVRPGLAQVIAMNARAWTVSGGVRIDLGSHVWIEPDIGVLLFEDRFDRVRWSWLVEGDVGVRVTPAMSIVGTAGRWMGRPGLVTPVSLGVDYRFR